MLSGNFHPILHRSRMALNQNTFSEVNFRCFEAMACGVALLMEQCGNGLDELFTPDEDISPIPYDAVEAARITADYLAMPKFLSKISENGRCLVARQHSGMARSQTLVEFCLEFLHTSVHHPRLSSVVLGRIFVRTAFGMIASELGQPRWRSYQKFFAHLDLN